MSATDLYAEAIAIGELKGTVVKATDMGTYAVEYSLSNWPVLPLRGKVPAIPSRDGGRGVLDATTDIDTVIGWWSGRYRDHNIGGRVPEAMIVLDIDPRHGGLDSLAELERRHGPVPETLTTLSGRGDGGKHLFYRRPSGKLSSARLGRGIDLKTPSGYVVLAPSIHPDTGQPYSRIDAAVAAPPAWLVDLLRPERIMPRSPRRHIYAPHSPSIADTYGASTSWADILEPHGWRCLDADPDADGARWLHPAATSACSATIRNGCLFVYSPNTPFDVTEASDPHGYTRFRACAVLDHAGDLRAAARTVAGKACKGVA